MQNHCDLWYEINDEHCKRWKRGFDKQPAGLFVALGLSYKCQIFFMQIDLRTKSYATCQVQVISAHDGDWFGHAAQEHVSAVQQMLNAALLLSLTSCTLDSA